MVEKSSGISLKKLLSMKMVGKSCTSLSIMYLFGNIRAICSCEDGDNRDYDDEYI